MCIRDRLLASALLNAAYFAPIVISAFFRKGDFESAPGAEAPLSMLVPIVILAVTCIVFGIQINFYVPFVEKIAAYLL